MNLATAIVPTIGFALLLTCISIILFYFVVTRKRLGKSEKSIGIPDYPKQNKRVPQTPQIMFEKHTTPETISLLSPSMQKGGPLSQMKVNKDGTIVVNPVNAIRPILPTVGIAEPPAKNTKQTYSKIETTRKDSLLPINSVEKGKLPHFSSNSVFPEEFLESQFPLNTKTKENEEKDKYIATYLETGVILNDTFRNKEKTLSLREPASFTPYVDDYVQKVVRPSHKSQLMY